MKLPGAILDKRLLTASPYGAVVGSAQVTAMQVRAVRLLPGDDVLGELVRLSREFDIRAGLIMSCVGSLSQARLRMPSDPGEPETFLALDEPMEIVSLSGTLCRDGLHLHLGLSRRDGQCVGGHLVEGCRVRTTAEIVIGEATELEFRRPHDPATGYGELAIKARGGASD